MKVLKCILLVLLGISSGIILSMAAGFAQTPDYFPLTQGNRWEYSPSYGQQGNRIDTIVGNELIKNTHTYIWNRQEAPNDNFNEKMWFAKDGFDLTMYKYWNNEGIQSAIILATPALFAKLAPTVGDTWV